MAKRVIVAIILVITLLAFLLAFGLPLEFTSNPPGATCRGLVNIHRLSQRLSLLSGLEYISISKNPLPDMPSPIDTFKTLCYGNDKEFKDMTEKYLNGLLDAAKRGEAIILPDAFAQNRLVKELGMSEQFARLTDAVEIPVDATGDSASITLTLYAPLNLSSAPYRVSFVALTSNTGSVCGISTITTLGIAKNSYTISAHRSDPQSISPQILWTQKGIGMWVDLGPEYPCNMECGEKPAEGTWFYVNSNPPSCDIEENTRFDRCGSTLTFQIEHLLEWHPQFEHPVIGSLKPIVLFPVIRGQYSTTSGWQMKAGYRTQPPCR